MPVAADLYYFIHDGGGGGSPPLILIHGAGGDHLYWPPKLRRLPGYRVFAVDLPGHGKSVASSQQSVDGYARSVIEWMDAVVISSAILVGHSMGGAIAMKIALDYPERSKALGLVGVAGRLRVNPDILEFSSNDKTFQRAVELVIQWGFSSHAPTRLVELAAKRMSETRPSVLFGDFMACNAFNVVDRLEEIAQPVLIIGGADDCMTPIRYLQLMANKIPNANLEIVPDAGHMVMLEKPEAVAGLLKSFLKLNLDTIK